MKDNAAHKPSSGFFFPFLDGLRGLAVLSIVVHHSLYFNPSSRIGMGLNGLLNAGRLGVAIFFVMSGFLMGLVVFDSPQRFDWSGYALRRAAKIVPPFLLSLLVASVLWIPLHGAAGVPFTIFADVTTLANFLGTTNEMNPLYWSLFIEIHFYIVLPVIFVGLRHISRGADIWTCFIFFIPAAIRALMYWLGGPSYRHGYGSFQTVFPLRLDAFAPGLAFAAFYLRRRGTLLTGRLAGSLPWAGLALVGAAYLFYGATHFVHILSGAHREGLFMELAYLLSGSGTLLLLFLCFGPKCRLGRILSNRTLGFIGLVSYELYLFHYPPKIFVRSLFAHSNGNLGIYVLGTLVPIAGSIALSALIYFKLSAPVLAQVKRFTRSARISKVADFDQPSPKEAVKPEFHQGHSIETSERVSS